jgi:hypothetical protein
MVGATRHPLRKNAMTLTIEIPDELAGRLTEDDIEAIRRDVRESAARRAAYAQPDLPPLDVIRNMTREEARELFRTMVPPDRPILPDEALTRESLYED